MGMALYEHNQKAYEAAFTLMNEAGKAAVVHPTGTGKSFIGFKLAEQHPEARIYWLSPSEYIYRTQLENLKAAGGDDPRNIQFLTYTKLMMSDSDYIEGISPDYIILDEFHRCGAAEWGKGVERLLSTYPHARVLGLSATNIRYLDARRDMADELFDGNIASEITLGEAIARGILLAPTYVVSVYAYQKELERYERRIARAKNLGVQQAAKRVLDSLRRALEKADGLDVVFERHMTDKNGKFIVFCSDAEHMREMKTKALEWFGRVDKNPRIYTLYSEDTASAREFAAFKADTSEHLKLLFCIDMLNEGVHVEDVSGVVLFRPTVSPIIYKQQIGRALSAGKGREPLIFDIVNNFENLYSIGAVAEELNQAFRLCSFDSENTIREKFRVIDEVRDCRELFEQLQETLSASWDVMCAAAKQYFQEHENLLVPHRYKTPDGLSLGSWIFTQRRVKSGSVPGILTEERIRKLDEIHMVWDNLADFGWKRNYMIAKTYYEQNGNLDVIFQYVAPEGFLLGSWICNLRQWRKAGRLSEERIRQLDDIGMIWDKNGESWERYFNAAERFCRKQGHLDIPAKYISADGLKLGAWIRSTRRAYHGNQGAKLSEEQIRRLEGIGMLWDTKFDRDWECNYKAAKEYYKTHGHLDVPVNYVTDSGMALGKWISRHKTSKNTNEAQIKLTPERRTKLAEIGMTWDNEDPWEIRYRLAKAYYERYGNLRISQSYVTENGIWLGKWLHIQKLTRRGQMPGERLTAEQIAALDAIGMDWRTVPEQLWDEYYTSAVSYYQKHQHLNVPAGYLGINGKRLDRWLRQQQKRYGENKLSKEQIKRLDAIGMGIGTRRTVSADVIQPKSAALPPRADSFQPSAQ